MGHRRRGIGVPEIPTPEGVVGMGICSAVHWDLVGLVGNASCRSSTASVKIVLRPYLEVSTIPLLTRESATGVDR
jgi:hypothetical protein